jgi:hypothetical protein
LAMVPKIESLYICTYVLSPLTGLSPEDFLRHPVSPQETPHITYILYIIRNRGKLSGSGAREKSWLSLQRTFSLCCGEVSSYHSTSRPTPPFPHPLKGRKWQFDSHSSHSIPSIIPPFSKPSPLEFPCQLFHSNPTIVIISLMTHSSLLPFHFQVVGSYVIYATSSQATPNPIWIESSRIVVHWKDLE